MENKITILKDIQERTHELDPAKEDFDRAYSSLSEKALSCMEGVNDLQEKNWIEKGRKIILNPKPDSQIGSEERDRALSYLKEATHTVILREENYRD